MLPYQFIADDKPKIPIDEKLSDAFEKAGNVYTDFQSLLDRIGNKPVNAKQIETGNSMFKDMAVLNLLLPVAAIGALIYFSK